MSEDVSNAMNESLVDALVTRCEKQRKLEEENTVLRTRVEELEELNLVLSKMVNDLEAKIQDIHDAIFEAMRS
jgi:peptidoglycan hydrolase CwlO-like protein